MSKLGGKIDLYFVTFIITTIAGSKLIAKYESKHAKISI